MFGRRRRGRPHLRNPVDARQPLEYPSWKSLSRETGPPKEVPPNLSAAAKIPAGREANGGSSQT